MALSVISVPDRLLQQLSKCSRLTQLSMSGTGFIISDASLQQLSAVSGLQVLKVNNPEDDERVYRHSITPAGLSVLQHLQQLHTLDLKGSHECMLPIRINRSSRSAPAVQRL